MSIKGQGHSVKTSSVIGIFQEIGVQNLYNGDVRILIESCEIAVQNDQEQPRTTGATLCGLQVEVPLFLVLYL